MRQVTDQATDPRPGEELPRDRLQAYLGDVMPEWGETPEHLEREAMTVDRLDRLSDVAVPSVHWSDPGGRIFGRPAMLMEFVPGHCLVADLDSPHASTTLAETLARIHDAVSAARQPAAGPTKRPGIVGVGRALIALLVADGVQVAVAADLQGLAVGYESSVWAIVVIAATIFSSINALTLSPALAALVLRPPPEKKNFFFRGFDKFFQKNTTIGKIGFTETLD